ncbi:hypothetical protein [Aquimarina sp. AU474]|uniref:hypothetical protein n=1 Tax=Aquimarina sp. AU474 TaxID=2108529 RepID=UPI000D6974E1|nr:hypothetical protein [Aquimarina sp. AU474]
MKNILNLKGAKMLSSKQQKEINGGMLPPIDFRFCCGCIVPNNQGILEIIQVSCDLNCPDGSPSVSGLGC